jgi:serine/threonine protein kinase
MGRLATDLVAAKLEVLDDPDLASALEREAQVYSDFSATTRVEDIPLPKIYNAFCLLAGKNPNFFASVSLGSDVTVKFMCLEYLDVDQPRKIWKVAKDKLADDLEVTASLRYLILDALYALLYLVQKGIAHRDFKLPHHVGFRPHNDQLVVFDFGMAEVDGIAYGRSVSRPLTKVNQQGISLGFVAASTTKK